MAVIDISFFEKPHPLFLLTRGLLDKTTNVADVLANNFKFSTGDKRAVKITDPGYLAQTVSRSTPRHIPAAKKEPHKTKQTHALVSALTTSATLTTPANDESLDIPALFDYACAVGPDNVMTALLQAPVLAKRIKNAEAPTPFFLYWLAYRGNFTHIALFFSQLEKIADQSLVTKFLATVNFQLFFDHLAHSNELGCIQEIFDPALTSKQLIPVINEHAWYFLTQFCRHGNSFDTKCLLSDSAPPIFRKLLSQAENRAAIVSALAHNPHDELISWTSHNHRLLGHQQGPAYLTVLADFLSAVAKARQSTAGSVPYRLPKSFTPDLSATDEVTWQLLCYAKGVPMEGMAEHDSWATFAKFKSIDITLLSVPLLIYFHHLLQVCDYFAANQAALASGDQNKVKRLADFRKFTACLRSIANEQLPANLWTYDTVKQEFTSGWASCQYANLMSPFANIGFEIVSVVTVTPSAKKHGAPAPLPLASSAKQRDPQQGKAAGATTTSSDEFDEIAAEFQTALGEEDKDFADAKQKGREINALCRDLANLFHHYLTQFVQHHAAETNHFSVQLLSVFQLDYVHQASAAASAATDAAANASAVKDAAASNTKDGAASATGGTNVGIGSRLSGWLSALALPAVWGGQPADGQHENVQGSEVKHTA